MKKQTVSKGVLLENVVYTTDNIIVTCSLKEARGKSCIFLGHGFSLSIDHNHRIVKHDPGMKLAPTELFEDKTVYSLYYTFECAGLEEAAEDIVNFIKEYLFSSWSEIWLVGHSKAGLCFYRTCYKLNEYSNRIKLVTISSSFRGTIVVDKKAFLKKMLFFERPFYNAIFSDHKVDRDLAPDSNFIKLVQTTPNLSCCHLNYVSEIELSSIKRPVDIALLYLNKAKHINGDGIVPLSSQLLDNNIFISASHATSLKVAVEDMILRGMLHF